MQYGRTNLRSIALIRVHLKNIERIGVFEPQILWLVITRHLFCKVFVGKGLITEFNASGPMTLASS